MPQDPFGGTKLLDPDHILNDILKLDFESKVADLGCGSMAYFTLESAKIVGSDGVVYAVDILKDVLSSVKTKAEMEGYHNIKAVWSNLEIQGATKVPEEMDYVYLVSTLFQNKNHLPILQEAVRLIKPGGKLLIVEWQPKNTAIGPDPTKRIPAEKIKQYAQDLNLKLEKEFAAGPYHYGLIFRK